MIVRLKENLVVSSNVLKLVQVQVVSNTVTDDSVHEEVNRATLQSLKTPIFQSGTAGTGLIQFDNLVFGLGFGVGFG